MHAYMIAFLSVAGTLVVLLSMVTAAVWYVARTTPPPPPYDVPVDDVMAVADATGVSIPGQRDRRSYLLEDLTDQGLADALDRWAGGLR